MVVELVETTRVFVYTQKVNDKLFTCSSFFPYSVKVTDMFFEILKEGTEN